jgi:hypothetical protein
LLIKSYHTLSYWVYCKVVNPFFAMMCDRSWVDENLF